VRVSVRVSVCVREKVASTPDGVSHKDTAKWFRMRPVGVVSKNAMLPWGVCDVKDRSSTENLVTKSPTPYSLGHQASC